MRCSSDASICHSSFSSLAAEIFPAWVETGTIAVVKNQCVAECLASTATQQAGWNPSRDPQKRDLSLSPSDLIRQVGFIVTIYDEDGLRLAATLPLATPADAFAEARKIVDNKVESPKT
jgi:hypothetical protein